MTIPKEVKNIIESLKKKGFEAYIVGGCVRDFLLGKEPQDWDITTNAKPEEIQKIFSNSFYENKFLTVTIKTESKIHVNPTVIGSRLQFQDISKDSKSKKVMLITLMFRRRKVVIQKEEYLMITLFVRMMM